MTRAEYLKALGAALRKQHVADVQDILSEYDDHFVCKLADGYSEEEISARLGNPAALAAQFAPSAAAPRANKALTVTGLCFADVFAGAVFVLLAAFALVLAAFALISAATAICLLGKLSYYGLIPPMPYGSALIFSIALLALCTLTVCGTIWFITFLRQLVRAFSRFQHNAMAAANGHAPLPALPIAPQLCPWDRRRLRTAALIALIIFAAAFVLGIFVSIVSAGSFQFWHVWGWFGYGVQMWQ